MIKRILDALQYGWRYRHTLYDILQQSGTVPAFDDTVDCVVLDVDGVLTPHGVASLTSEMCDWLSLLQKNKKVYLLSNNMFRERKQWFTLHFPNIRIMTGCEKKPSPDGLLKIVAEVGLAPQTVILMDDRLLTGGLSAIRAGAKFYLVKPAKRNFRCHPIKECFFSVLRLVEQNIVVFVHTMHL